MFSQLTKKITSIWSREVSIDVLLNDKSQFESFVYTPIQEAKVLHLKRQTNINLRNQLSRLFHSGLPESFCEESCAVLSRQIATPNFEFRRFVSIVDLFDGFAPLIPEFENDKFSSRNSLKKSWLSLSFATSYDKIVQIDIADIEECEGKRFSEIRTKWGQPLLEFHRQLINETYRPMSARHFMDNSAWLAKYGDTASEYYFFYLLLFTQNAILFEDFVLDDPEEYKFARDVFLPNFIEIINKTGMKPLIVHLEPSQLEGRDFWFCYPADSLRFVENKINGVTL